MGTVILVVAIGAACAGFVQGLTGFAFGLVSLSFWAWVLDPTLAAVLAVFGSLVGQLIAVFSTRRGFDVKTLLPFLLGGVIGIPFGVVLLPHLDVTLFKAMLGTILVIWCPTMLLAKDLPAVTAGGKTADAAAGLAGGVMCGLGGFSGVIPTLWCSLRRMPKDRQRSVIQNFNLSMLTVTMASYLATGVITREMLPMIAVVGASLLIPVVIGARVYVAASEATFRRIVLVALTLSGIALLSSAVPKLVG
jgi:uncharacterized membrane protein YfcA